MENRFYGHISSNKLEIIRYWNLRLRRIATLFLLKRKYHENYKAISFLIHLSVKTVIIFTIYSVGKSIAHPSFNYEICDLFLRKTILCILSFIPR